MKSTTTKKTLRYQMQCFKYHDINSSQQKEEDWDIFLRLTCWIASERYNIQVDKNKTWHVIGDLYAKKIAFVTKIKSLTLSFYRTNFYKIIDNQTRIFFGSYVMGIWNRLKPKDIILVHISQFNSFVHVQIFILNIPCLKKALLPLEIRNLFYLHY